MKKSLKVPLNLYVFLLLLSSSLTLIAGGNDTYTVPLQEETKYEKEDEGRRIPARPITCLITPNGLQSSIDTADIISYEVWDEDDISCLATYADEMDFVRFIYTLHGEYIVRIQTHGHSYIGLLYVD